MTETSTLVISTHRYSLLELVERLVVLDNGRIVADGPKQKVLEALAARVKRRGWNMSAHPDRRRSFMIVTIVALLGAFIAWAAMTEVDEIARGNGKVYRPHGRRSSSPVKQASSRKSQSSSARSSRKAT